MLPQTIAILKTRASSIGHKLIIQDHKEFNFSDDVFGFIVQYPDRNGTILIVYEKLTKKAKEHDIISIVAADLLKAAILKEPAKFGADIAVGSSQRFGVPMGYGGPHAAYFATKEKFKRGIPGRIIGLSKDLDGNKAYRMALQTRKQHIRREKATSNICTSQVLLAVMASMYAVFHGQKT